MARIGEAITPSVEWPDAEANARRVEFHQAANRNLWGTTPSTGWSTWPRQAAGATGVTSTETGPDGAKRRDYIYLGNKLIAVDSCVTGNSPACAEWYHTDALGSVAARTNGAGTIVAQLDYQPWVEQWLVQGDGR